MDMDTFDANLHQDSDIELISLLEEHLKKERHEAAWENQLQSVEPPPKKKRTNPKDDKSSKSIIELEQACKEVDNCLIIIKKQMDKLLDTQYQLCLVKNNLLHSNRTNKSEQTSFHNPSVYVKNFINEFRAPYFKDSHYFSAPKNSDAKEFVKIDLIKTFCPWGNLDVEQLQNCVRESIVKAYLTSVSNKHSDISLVDHESKVECLLTINYFKKEPLTSFFTKEMEKNLDWITISDLMKGRFSPTECKKMWYLYARPAVNKKKWTISEIRKLSDIIKKHAFQNWDKIASDLQTDRSSFQCFLYYMKFMHKDIAGPWSRSEQELLKEVVLSSTYGNKICWNKVGYYFENRNFGQIFNKWTHSINPTIKKGHFELQEDRVLLTLKHKFNLEVEDLSKVIKNRTIKQIRERFDNTLTPDKDVKFGEWTEEEDNQLLALVGELGETRWSDIAKKLKTRNRVQVRHRYNCLRKKFAEDPNLTISEIRRAKRPYKSKRKVQNTQFLSRLANKKGKKMIKAQDIDKMVQSVYSKKAQHPSQIDLNLVNFFTEKLDSKMFPQNDPKNDTIYSLDQIANETQHLLNVLQANLKLDNTILSTIEDEVNKLGENGPKISNLLKDSNFMNKVFQQRNNPSTSTLSLLPPNLNTMYALWEAYSAIRHKSKTEFSISISEDSESDVDRALLKWHQRLHALFTWPSFLSVNRLKDA
ncbi:snRNA-activating protein complex subunit 4 [Cimex lectularius]|uniref:snRNA-activating protein complex subunit 4 n=1 Tax=Cimex lectularius TaxID=79782 RepID=A0A8I6RJC7_CIMLE|nr:snRNA-activating protein complex subunit 4 [Cimex lectularius]